MSETGGSPLKQFRAEAPGDLLDTQKSAVRIILAHFAKIANEALQGWHKSRNSDDSYNGRHHEQDVRYQYDELDVLRPHNVYCIDGGRGSGKTYTLLTFEYALRQLSRWHDKATDEEAPSKGWKEFFGAINSADLRALSARPLRFLSLAHVLTIIFPGDMEHGESLMESIFAAMTEAIDGASVNHTDVQAEPQYRPKGDRLQTKRTEEGRKRLKKILHENVAEGWYFAKRFGVDAIVRDSIDYKDLIDRYETESRKASGRIKAWRTFVDQYLDFQGALTLVVLLDDSDVQPELTQDILHSIRMFLNHPRVVTVVAGNLRSMRHSLLHQEMRRVAPSMAALDKSDRRTAQDWRRVERKAVEDYLEKIIPPAHRLFLRHLRSRDFEKIVGAELQDVCTSRMAETREDFLRAKFRLAIQRELGMSDAPTGDQPRKLEDFLSWWIFTNRYAGTLEPRSARQIAAFRDYYEPISTKDRESNRKHGRSLPLNTSPSPPRTRKRLPVMLFDNSENYTLIQRLSDEDVSLAFWLRQQDLASVWVGQRMFKINGREAYQGGYTYDYIRYRLDVGLAMPVRDNAEEAMPLGLIPRLRGRRHMRRFFRPQQMQRQQRRLGVSRWIDHAAIPGNCVYFTDLGVLPDASLLPNNSGPVDELQDGSWESELVGRWMELIEDDQEDDPIARYFTEVVCERLHDTSKVRSASLMFQLDPLSEPKFERGRYEQFAVAEINSFHTDKIGPEQWKIAREELANFNSGLGTRRDDGSTRAKTMIARYAALVTDLRRAWHSIRIHKNIPGIDADADAPHPQEHERMSLGVIANQRRMPLLSREELDHLFDEPPFQTSSWVARMLYVFRTTKFVDAIVNEEEKSFGDQKDYLYGIRKIYSAARGNFLEVNEEKSDYARWAHDIRFIGRALCAGWPLHDKNSEAAHNLEENLLEEDMILYPFVRGNVFSETGVDQKEGNQRRNARDARSFVWLMYGLAPSLPSIIHAHIMALVYSIEYGLDAEGKTNEKEENKIRCDYYEKEIGDEVFEWAKLIGALSVLMRYIKMKCVHLDTIFAFDNLVGSEDPPKPDDPLKREAICRNLIKKCNSHEGCNFTDENAMEQLRELRKRLFPKDLKVHEADKSLTIVPDVAPSTLFGDEWLIYMVARMGDEEVVDDDPLKLRGMFGETEQWLCAANRCLRKLNQSIQDAWGVRSQTRQPGSPSGRSKKSRMTERSRRRQGDV